MYRGISIDQALGDIVSSCSRSAADKSSRRHGALASLRSTNFLDTWVEGGCRIESVRGEVNLVVVKIDRGSEYIIARR
ncbi:hypothetical protein PV326_009344 [Microctonus aethiopoides]|nr:hypothetical protein PV326_009344 [Microctonus aethiopoides]